MALMLICTAVGFASCSDDDEGGTGNIDLPTPPYESVSGKYEITSASSPYESIELGASGNYIVTRNYGGYSMTAQAGAKTRRPMLAKGGGTTRSTEYGGIIYGTFTELGDNKYALEGFGTIKLNYSGDRMTGIEITTNGSTQTYTAEKAETMGDDDITNALCRTWKVEKVRDIYLDKETGKESDVTVTPENPGEFGSDMGNEVMFSKSGTYLISRLDGTIDIAEWTWRNRSKGEMYYAWDGEWTGDYATVTFDGNRAVVHDKWEDEYGRDESWTYLIAADAPETPDTDLPEELSPLANVFTGKLLKQMGDDQFYYENGYLTKIVNDRETITFHYNYATDTEGPDVYVTMRGDGDNDFDITLNKQGFAEKVVQTSHDQYGDYVYTKTFEYDTEGHLTAMNDDRNGRLYDLTWTDGDLTKVHWLSDSGNEYTYTYTYGNQPNTNCLLLYYKMYSVDIDEVQCLYYAGLLGKASKNLIETETSDDGTTVNFIWTDNSLLLSDDSSGEPTKFSFYE